jgi:hypothetical protein
VALSEPAWPGDSGMRSVAVSGSTFPHGLESSGGSITVNLREGGHV